MPELDIEASAREVAELLNQRQTRAAIERLDMLRQDQSLVVQESLDRYVAVHARERLSAMWLPGAVLIMDAERVGSAVDRLLAATGAPRFPAENETSLLSQAQLHDVYGSIVAARGNQAARDALATNGERVILGLRNETATTLRNGMGIYDDRLVLVWKGDNGLRHAHELKRSNTEPSAQYDHHAGSGGDRFYSENHGRVPAFQGYPGYETVIRKKKVEGEDVDRDGILDLGRLGEGTTEMHAATHPRYIGGRQDGTEFALRPTSNALTVGEGRVQRDTNADGLFTAADVNGVQDLNNTFKIHRGGTNNTDSAGCQTIRGTDYDVFIAELRRNPAQDRWQYVLTSVGVGQQPQEILLHDERGRPPPEIPHVAPAALPNHPDNPEHPDHHLLREIRERLGALGPRYLEGGEQFSMGLLAAAKANRLSRVDHLFPNQFTANLKAGEHLFLIQGQPHDPAAIRAVVSIAAAINTPVEDSLSTIEALNKGQAHCPARDAATHCVQVSPSIRLS